MNKNKNKNKSLSQWIVSLSLGIICTLEVLPLSVNAIEFPSAAERNPPKSTAAGGRRGGCVSGEFPIKAFTPGDDNYIKTASSQPQLFVYLPRTKAKFAQFVLRGQDGQKIDIQEIPVTKGDYIIKINLSEVETNKKYQWEISLICNPMFINTGNYIKGIVERVVLTPELESQLSENKDILKKAEIYANQGIWSETLSITSSFKDSQPGEWKELLTSVGLQDYLDKDFLFFKL